MAYLVRDRTNHADGVMYPWNWADGTCTFGHDITLETNLTLESRKSRTPAFVMRCAACRRSAEHDRLTTALQQPRWANAIKHCEGCGKRYRPGLRDINDPNAWAGRRYCGTSCSSAGAKTGPPAAARRPPLPNPVWRENAYCRDTNPNDFYVDGDTTMGTAATNFEQDVIRRYCLHCPVRTECLQTALALGDNYGVWGGTTSKQRKALRGTVSV